MAPRLSLLIVPALLATQFCATCARAGLNAGATARLYWQEGTAAGLEGRVSTSLSPQLLVTVRGVSSFRGADVQIALTGYDGCRESALPPAWDFSADGCNAGNLATWRGGNGGPYPSLFAESPALPGALVAQDGMLTHTDNCAAPPGQALLWLAVAGGAGVPRQPGAEYAVWAVRFDLGAHLARCAVPAGDSAGAPGVCLYPSERLPCADTQRGAVLGIVDEDLGYDYAPYDPGHAQLGWFAMPQGCPAPCADPKGRTWRELKKLYR